MGILCTYVFVYSLRLLSLGGDWWIKKKNIKTISHGIDSSRRYDDDWSSSVLIK